MMTLRVLLQLSVLLCFVGYLVGWLVGSLVSWLVGCLVSRFVYFLAFCKINSKNKSLLA